MTKRKQKKKRGKKQSNNKPGRPRKIIPPELKKARKLRSNLLTRSKGNTELRESAPSISELHKWLNLPNYTCYYSYEPLTIDTLVVDHKIPLARGGTNELDNLCFCSNSMNTIKGSMTEKEFRQLLELVKDWEDGGKNLFGRLQRGGYFRK